MALGAGAGQVLRLVMKESVVLVAVGAVLGFAGAVGLARVFSAITAQLAQIFAVGTGDPLLVIGGPLLLVTLALLASSLPARRATRIDPLSALREE
jgi:ABC-type antimicrobial peptide transport system permease subunit